MSYTLTKQNLNGIFFKHNKKFIIPKGGIINVINFVWYFTGIVCLSKTTHPSSTT